MARSSQARDGLGEMSRKWWAVVLRGLAAVLFGLVALLWPGKTMVALAIVFGVYAIVDAVVLFYSTRNAERGSRTPQIVQAVFTALLGLVALLWPAFAAVALVFVIGAWAIVTGVAEIVTATRLRARISSEWLLIFAGALSVVFGLMVWFWPLAGALAVMFVVGAYAVIFGIALVAAGLRLRGAADHRALDEEIAEADTLGTPEEERPSAFDPGYAEGYHEGYQGDPKARPGRGTEGDPDVLRRSGGRHRRPEDPGA